MKYNTGIVLSTVVALLLTGCVKPTGEANTTGTDTKSFDDTATSGTYTDTQSDASYTPTYANDVINNATTYGTSEIDNTVIATDNTYGATSTYDNTQAYGTTTTTPSYDTSSTYGTAPSYDNTVTTAPSYGTAGGAYGNPNTPSYGTAGGAYGNPNTSSYGTGGGAYSNTNTPSYGTGGGAYGNPNASGGYNTSNDVYAAASTSSSSGGYNNTYSSTPATTNTGTYTTNNSYESSSSSGGGGIHLQVAALKDYYSALEYKNNLSLDPKYSAYVKKGSTNKVIVTGLESRSAAKALAARQFPGAFIVAGSPLNSSSSSSYSSSSSSSSYGSSSSSNGSSYSGNGIGVQVGAFSSYSKAKVAAKNAAGSRYTALVKTVDSRGKKIYKAIITGFSSVSSARSAIASGEFGSAFLVTNLK